MSVSQDLIWQLTKRNNAHLVKFNENMFSRHPLNMTGFHNASQAASTVGVASGKNGKKIYVGIRHGANHGINKKAVRKVATGSKADHSTTVHGTVSGARRAINAEIFMTHSARRNALKRLQRVAHSTRTNVNGMAAIKARDYRQVKKE
jgi:hypothetical protein